MAEGKVNCEVLIIGGSAGSISIINKLIPKLPAQFPMPVIIVLHRKENSKNLLVENLKNKSQLIVKEAELNEPILQGKVYVAPANYHLLIEPDKTMTLDYSEKILYSRPSIDVSMFSIANAYKQKVLGILLTGSNSDGTQGMNAIKTQGGFTIIQNPKAAEFPEMPQSAISRMEPDKILDERDILDFLLNYIN